MAEGTPLILVSGMGADERLFDGQKAALPSVLAAHWIPVEPGDTLPSYARRLAAAVDPRGPCFLGGCSFGGMLALEMTRHLDARACFLIATIRSPDEFPWWLRALEPFVAALPGFSLGIPGRLVSLVLRVANSRFSPARRSVLRQFADADGRHVRWAGLAALRWKPTLGPIPCPVFQIHGDRDWLLPFRRTHPDLLVRGAGHLLPVTHPEAVNQFLRDHLSETANAAACPADGLVEPEANGDGETCPPSPLAPD